MWLPVSERGGVENLPLHSFQSEIFDNFFSMHVDVLPIVSVNERVSHGAAAKPATGDTNANFAITSLMVFHQLDEKN